MGSVAALILAAGASLRLGTPKQLVRIGSETLLQRAVRVTIEADLEPIYGVVPSDLCIDAYPGGMIRVVNHAAAEGMSSSIRAGLQALVQASTSVSGAVILACDQPAISSQHLRELARGESHVVASAYDGRKGVPAYFPADVFASLFALQGDSGAREILVNARAVALPGGELDIDTIEDLHRARKLYAG